MRRRLAVLALALPLAPALALAQQGADPHAPAKQPPIRPLGAVVATAADSFGVVAGVRGLADGRVLVNDMARRRVVLLDTALRTARVVADTTSATGNAYSGQFAGLIPFRGDSSLFIDPMALTMLVLDPQGEVKRVMSVPRAQDAMALMSMFGGVPGFDATGRLVYRGNNFAMPQRSAGGAFQMPQQPDSAPIVRMNLATRKLDTAAFIRVAAPKVNVTQGDDGRMSVAVEVNPLPQVDEWAVLSDGTLALLRGRDYRIDLIAPDGTPAGSAKIPFDWQRLSDEDKVALIDSVKAQRERMAQNPAAAIMAGGGAMQMTMRARTEGGATAGGGAGGEQRTMVFRGGEGAPPPRGGANGGGPAGNNRPMQPQISFVSPSELPDYKPPFMAGAVRADMDGRLWVRTVPTRKLEGGAVYDVIDRAGTLVERVQLPANRMIVGFAPGAVFLAGREGERWVLERARMR